MSDVMAGPSWMSSCLGFSEIFCEALIQWEIHLRLVHPTSKLIYVGHHQVRKHQIFTKWPFRSDLHNMQQRSALVSWPINRCPLSTQQCTVLLLKRKKRKGSKTWSCTKIKQNTTSQEGVRFCFSLMLQSPRGQADTGSPQWPFSLLPLLTASCLNNAWAQLDTLWVEEGFVKQTWWSKIFDSRALPKG